MKCYRCGGTLNADHAGRLATAHRAYEAVHPSPPKHRKKRIQKKLLKKYEREQRATKAALSMVAFMGRPSFRCGDCGKQEGFYSAIGRNLIQIQPMPPGAIPHYWAEPLDVRPMLFGTPDTTK